MLHSLFSQLHVIFMEGVENYSHRAFKIKNEAKNIIISGYRVQNIGVSCADQ